MDEWIQEEDRRVFRVIRGGSLLVDGKEYPVSYRSSHGTNFKRPITGFRAALYIK